MQRIEINSSFKKAIDLLERSDEHLFITGRAGTGKSTLLQHWVENTAKNVVVLAPTGVAALNVRGETIHSFFGFRPDVTVKQVLKRGKDATRAKIIRQTDTILIDEASMVRADLLDCIDQSLRVHEKRARHIPFGGKQMVFIGDLHQLPPVVPSDQEEIFRTHYATPYFFSAHVFRSDKLMGIDDPPELRHVELTKIYRQTDRSFI
jgi:ATP-dependent DNA helicase PIF1